LQAVNRADAHRQRPATQHVSGRSAWAHDSGADLAKTDVNGGAIAIRRPLGASGARIMTTLVNAPQQRGGRYGLQTMCDGGGMANATIIERLG
jgi:acetyl-CoA acyltransferase